MELKKYLALIKMTAEGVDYLFVKSNSKDNVIYQNTMSLSNGFMARFKMKKSKSIKSLCFKYSFISGCII